MTKLSYPVVEITGSKLAGGGTVDLAGRHGPHLPLLGYGPVWLPIVNLGTGVRPLIPLLICKCITEHLEHFVLFLIENMYLLFVVLCRFHVI